MTGMSYNEKYCKITVHVLRSGVQDMYDTECICVPGKHWRTVEDS